MPEKEKEVDLLSEISAAKGLKKVVRGPAPAPAPAPKGGLTLDNMAGLEHKMKMQDKNNSGSDDTESDWDD